MNLPKQKELKWLVIGLITASILIGLNLAAKRYQYESKNNTVEMVMSLNEVVRLAKLGGVDRTMLLNRLSQEVGITSIAVEEDTLASFQEKGMVTVLKGSEIINLLRVGQVYRTILTHLAKKTSVKPDRIYIVIDEFELYERIKSFLIASLETGSVKERGSNILEIISDEATLMEIGLGFSPATARELSGHGLGLIPRFRNNRMQSESLVKLKFKDLSKLGTVSTVLFESDSVLGYPSKLADVATEMTESGVNMGYIEFSKQMGDNTLARMISTSVVRVHSISEDEMEHMGERQMITRYLRSAKERGARVLLLHPLFFYQGVDNIVEHNLSSLMKLKSFLTDFGFTVGKVSKLPSATYVPISGWESFILSVGLFVWAVLLIQLFIPIKRNPIIIASLIALVIFSALFSIGKLSEWNRLMALVTACSFPTFAIISMFPKQSQIGIPFKKRALQSHLYILKISGLCLVAAIYIVGFMADSRFFLGIYQFYGVKISFLFPIILVGLYYYLRPNRVPALYFVIKRLFHSPITTGSFLAAITCVVFMSVYILRSGNYLNIAIVETWMRNTLESLLFVRPRTKEFLIGFPLLMTAYMFVDSKISRHWIWFFNALGAVALISIVNSFCHVHTPLVISLYRSIIGVIFGFIFAWIYIGVFAALKSSVRRLG
jgi:hypothetical protein